MTDSMFFEKWIFRMIQAALHSEAIVKVVSPLAVFCGLLTVSVIGFPQSVCAQQNLLTKVDGEPADDLQRLPSDRKILQQLQELTRLARGDNMAKIRDVLQLLRAADPSLMVPDGSRTFHPLHRDLIERIQAFPAALQTEILNDADATKPLLKTAYENEGPAAVVRFLHRHSGSEESLKALICGNGVVR